MFDLSQKYPEKNKHDCKKTTLLFFILSVNSPLKTEFDFLP